MIELNGVTKTRAGLAALDDVTLELDGGLTALLGRNGAGKSTLLSILAGLMFESSGRFSLRAQPLGRRRAALRAETTLLPQDLVVDPRAPAEEFVRYLLRLRGRPDRLVGEMFERFGLNGVARRPLGELSGGTRRRVGLAYACACDTPILLLDEPTQGLDPLERLALADYLTEIGRSKLVVYSTHIISDVSWIAPRLVVLDQGRVVHDGSPDKLLAATPPVFEVSCPTGADVERIRANGLVTRLARGDGDDYAVRWIPSTAGPHDGAEVEPTLDDAYLALCAQGPR
ncbi:ATP-binding cassette domain-containing protein [Nonomuraea endophytica]|uniref:ABC-type multidrug transport system ATPase subunit n=1 Tax=Nonomuraea endophytica TaxID=714136 RepID=A0A7W8A6F7_9ACTN|nr:ATP-binding cassette domain-containing protein [Nonomuraea endophytica]MBB5079536.1 ABC-type multidrug transport system ATPase subunit [Nonomuraea endophytica]